MTDHAFARPAASLLRATIVAVAAAAGAAGPAPVQAQPQQVQAVEPYCVAVTSDSVALKSGAGAVYYAVAMLKSGQVLRVDGQAPAGWLRVEYPRGLKAFLKAEDATSEDDGKTIRLTKASELMAVNMTGGERVHWRWLVEDPKPAGTRFPVIETLRTPDNHVYGYLVAAPGESRGYVKTESTRRATPDEAENYARSMGAVAAVPEAPKAAKPPAPALAEKPAGAPTAHGGAGGTEAQPADPFSPGAPAGGGVVRPGSGAQPAPGTLLPEGEQPAPPADKPAERKAGTVESLQSLYEQVQGGKDAELPSVIAEFERSISGLGTGTEDQRTATFLKARLEVLRLRQTVLAQRQSAGEANRSVDVQQKQLTEQVTALEKARNYAMVGRLVPSTVYDGKRLPKMYRVQSLEPGFARTVGYLFPAANTELDAKLGRVIGVVGEVRFDESLRLNIVSPKRVDVLSATDVPAAARDTKADGKPVADGNPAPSGDK